MPRLRSSDCEERKHYLLNYIQSKKTIDPQMFQVTFT